MMAQVPCFPPAYDVFALYTHHYHLKFQQLMAMLVEKGSEVHTSWGGTHCMMRAEDEISRTVVESQPPPRF
jgi:hypothetical protein